jgi:FAD/FMN-containing dehydrogenase
MVAPPLPFLPPEFAGRLIVMAILVYAGESEAGERAIAPFRALAEPIMDMIKPMPYPEIYPPEDDSYHPTAVARTMFVDSIDDGCAETIIEFLESSDASLRVAQLRVLGGAMARVPVDATAFAHRSSRIMVNVAAFYDGEEDRPRREQWVAEFADALRQSDDGAYVGFLADEGEERVRAAYPGSTWDRLAAVKAKYDPANVFRLNQNIPPLAKPSTS